MWYDLLATVVYALVEDITSTILGPIISMILALFGFAEE